MSRKFIVAAFALVLCPTSGRATIVEGLEIEDLTVRASDIVTGTVLDTSAHWEGGLIFTDVAVEVDRCYKGPCDQATMVVRVLGGEVDGIGQAVEGMPNYQPGEDVFLFLEAFDVQPVTRLRTVGLAQGVFRLDFGHGRSWAVRDLTGLVLVGPQSDSAKTLVSTDLPDLLTRVNAALDR